MKLQVPAPPVATWHPTGRERLFSPERDDVLRRCWPAGVLPKIVLAEINDLPGPQVTKDQIATRATSLRLKRPDGFASVCAKMGGVSPGHVQKWTPARVAILLRDYQTKRDLHEIVKELSDMGPGSLSTKAVQDYASSKLKLRRPKKVTAAYAQEPCAFAPEPRPAPEPIDVAHCPPEQPPGADGLVEAVFGTVRAWAEPRGIWFDGTNVDAVNVCRARAGLAPFIVVG